MAAWWGNFELVENQPKIWAFGERMIAVMRSKDEFSIWNIETDAEISAALTVSDTVETGALDNRYLTRNLYNNTPTTITVKPRLADRSVVARPAASLRVLPSKEGRILISTPLWFSAETMNDKETLVDIPFWRPSDSWFGPSNREGEMCYAKYTDARLQHDALEHRPHRAITPITIINRSRKALVIERINVPVPLLNLYNDNAQRLWSQSLTIVRETDKATVEVRLDKTSPPEIGETIEVSPPRVVSEKQTLIRSLASLFA